MYGPNGRAVEGEGEGEGEGEKAIERGQHWNCAGFKIESETRDMIKI
jgi:hypothetical protein